MNFVPQSLSDELQERCVTSCADLLRSVRLFHMLSFASLLYKSLGYFGALLKRNIRAWSGEHNRLRRLRTKPFFNTF
jgi:hypothetical protein